MLQIREAPQQGHAAGPFGSSGIRPFSNVASVQFASCAKVPSRVSGAQVHLSFRLKLAFDGLEREFIYSW